jgi:ubiquinone/menaquinone biosynthesis C-methylase UbiE
MVLNVYKLVKQVLLTRIHICTGVGNSMLFEEMMEDSLFPSSVDVTNIDISETAIDWINKALSQSKKKSSGCVTRYVTMDATNMTFETDTFDFVFDKGCMDAVRNVNYFYNI